VSTVITRTLPPASLAHVAAALLLACDPQAGPLEDELEPSRVEPGADELTHAWEASGAITPLTFFEVGTIPYPVTTTGIGTGMTVGMASGDPYLFFVTQTTLSDPVVVLHLDIAQEMFRYDTPPGRDTVGGLAYDWHEHTIWATQGTTGSTVMFEIDPTSGAELSAVMVPSAAGNGLAFNGNNLLRADADALLGPSETELDLLSQAGVVINSTVRPGVRMEGLSIAPLSYMGSDTTNNTVWIATLWLDTYAAFVPPGTPSATRAIAYDTVRDYDHIAQYPTENGSVGRVGTLYHPDTPWSPAPWGGRHRIYLANEADQTIHFGYLTP
jgi:hypothetical protein